MAARKYSPEFKESCVLEVVRNSRTVAQVARENGVVEQTLRNWVGRYRQEVLELEEELTVSEGARVRELEKEVRELRAEKEFLGKAAAFFAKEFR